MTLRTRIKGRLHRLGGDDRAVSPVVGFVLIFALIIIVFTLYQTNVVPAQNTEIEFKHGQDVQTDLNGLNDAIKATSADGTPRSQTIATGVQYPSRALAINPGPPIGTLRTQPAPDLELDGIDVPGSAYWDGDMASDEVFTDLKSLSYSIEYNRKQQDPSFSLQQGFVMKGYGSGRTLPVGGESSPIVSGRQVNLYLLGGEYQESAVTASPTVKPISTSTEYLQFESTPDTEIPLDSGLTVSQCRDKWTRILGPNHNSTTGDHPHSRVECDSSGQHVMHLQSDTQLSIRITKVGFGDVDQSKPLEVVPTDTSRVSFEGPTAENNVPTVERNATLNESASFTVTVRDKFGNPVSDARLVTNESNVTPVAPTTNDEGKVTFSYTPGETGSNTIAVEIDTRSTDYDTAKFRFDVSDPEATGSGYGPGNPVPAVNLQSSSLVSFDIESEKPLEVTGFSVETRHDFVELNETAGNNNRFEIPQVSLEYSRSTPLQLDGRNYSFQSPDSATVTDSHVELYGFSPNDKEIEIQQFVQTPGQADVVVELILEDGSTAPIYLEGHLKECGECNHS